MSTPADGTRAEPVTPTLLRNWPLPGGGSSKDDRGSVLVIGGARKTPGAALLAGLAALRAGAGRLTLGVAESTAIQLAIALPESGVVGWPKQLRVLFAGMGWRRWTAYCRRLARCWWALAWTMKKKPQDS